MFGCGSRQDNSENEGYIPLPGNPKGEIYPDDFYDAGGPTPEAQAPDAGVPTPPPPPDAAAEPEAIPMPGNPKGALYVDDVYDTDND